ncbi:MAG: polyprenyl synthetase family protein [Anaerolineae bacterium]|nr:polyprenyl synthetase family protein [Anaerolineae bacterium]
MSLSTIQDLIHATHQFLETEILPYLEWNELERSIQVWLERHKNYPQHQATDILPTLTCALVNGNYQTATPLSAHWLLYVLAARVFDDIQDGQGGDSPWNQRGLIQSLPIGLALLTAANVCFTFLDHIDQATAYDIQRTLGRTWSLAAKSQSFPPGKSLSLERYFETVIANTAIIFAAGAWSGARLATTNEDALQRVYDYGYNLGIMSAIVSDVNALKSEGGKKSDIAAGQFNLPVIYGMSLEQHPFHESLAFLLHHDDLTPHEVAEVVSLLEAMGAVEWSLQLAITYQQKAIAALDPFPAENKEYLLNYVSKS